MYPSEGFWSRILTWRASAFVNFTRWIGFCMSVLYRRRDFGGFVSWKTQLNCRAVDDRRWEDPRSNFNTSLIRLPWSIVTLVGNRSSFIPITLLQHGYCTFVIVLFGPFSRLFLNLTRCIRALHQTDNQSWSCREAFWRVPLFTKWVIASSFEVILASHRDILPLRLLPLGLRVLDAFRSLCCMKQFGDVFDCVIFHAYWHRGGNCNCLLLHIACWFPIANNVQEFFVHASLFPDSWPPRSSHNFHFWRQNYYFENLVRWFFSP